MSNAMLKLMPSTMLKLKPVQGNSLPIPGFEPWYVNPSDPALSVMIDFRTRPSVTISETETLDRALEHMKHTGVRCCFVTDDKRSAVTGMITAYDITGEKRQQFMRFTGVAHDDVQVKDIMQKIGDWRVADIRDIERATVGDVLEIFGETGMTHLPVTEPGEGNEQRLRGLLSSAKVKRLLVEMA